jgi:hypothetical protein
MAMESTWCPVLQSYVTCVTDSDGWVAAVFCPELDRSRHTCRMKREALLFGALQSLFPPSAEASVADLVAKCPMA